MLLDLDVSGFDPGTPLQPGAEFGAVKFSPDGSRLYASGFGPTIVFDTETGEELRRVPGNGILAVSPDGSRIAVRDAPFAVRIVDPSGVDEPTTIPLSSLPSVADFSPDSRQLAIAAGNSMVVASAGAGDIAETLHDDGAVIAVEFRPNGELVTAGVNGAIITWDLGDWSAGFRTDTFTRQTAFVELDERTVALEQSDGMTQVIVADPAAWIGRACQVAGRVLTEQEWAEHLGARPYAPACRE